MTQTVEPVEIALPIRKQSNLITLFILFGVFLVVGLALWFRSLGYYWVEDDLHLIRTRTLSQLFSTWVGTWDIDKLETSGLRPFTALFNHLRAFVFGEAVEAHRLFLIGLYALCLTIFSAVLLKLKLPFWVVAIGALMALTAQTSAFHVTFISDGIHIFQGVTFGLAAWTLILALEGNQFYLGLSLLFAGICLLTREEGIGLLVTLGLLAIYCYFKQSGNFKTVRLYCSALAVMLIVFWLWRGVAVPQAASLKLDAGIFRRLITQLNNTIWLADHREYGRLFQGLAGLAFILALVYPFIRRNRSNWEIAMGLLVLAGINCLPALYETRSNLVFFPTYFYTTGLVAIVAVYLELLRPNIAVRAGLVLLLALELVISSRSNILTQESLSFYSITTIIENTYWAYDQEAIDILLPQRRQYLVAGLEGLGIKSNKFDQQLLINGLYCWAVSEGSYHPPETNIPFIPIVPSFEDEPYLNLKAAHC
jgi:hypothetical protein